MNTHLTAGLSLLLLCAGCAAPRTRSAPGFDPRVPLRVAVLPFVDRASGDDLVSRPLTAGIDLVPILSDDALTREHAATLVRVAFQANLERSGLRVLPGTHTQGVWSTLFSKIHFVTQRPDPREIAVETWPGDLTVHDGRMWHRVEASPREGWSSLRRSMYVPYVCDTWQPKDASSPTPAYMRLFDSIMRWRANRARRQLARALTAKGE